MRFRKRNADLPAYPRRRFPQFLDSSPSARRSRGRTGGTRLNIMPVVTARAGTVGSSSLRSSSSPWLVFGRRRIRDGGPPREGGRPPRFPLVSRSRFGKTRDFGTRNFHKSDGARAAQLAIFQIPPILLKFYTKRRKADIIRGIFRARDF